MIETNPSDVNRVRCLGPIRLALLLGLLLATLTPTLRAQVSSGGLYSLPRTQDDLAELNRAREEIANASYDAAVERLHRLIDHGRPGVVPSTGVDRFIGLRQAVIEILRDLPANGRAAYERLVERQAGNLVSQPLPSLRREELEGLAQRYPTSESGIRARIRLGDLALERGDATAAAHHFRAARDAAPRRPGLDVRERAARALRDADHPITAEAGGDVVVEQMRSLRPASHPGRWSAFGGGGAGSRTMPSPIGEPVPIAAHRIPAPGFLNHAYRPMPFPIQPVGDLDGVYINDGLTLWTVDPLGLGTDPRPFPGPMADAPVHQFNSVARSINPDMTLTAAFDDEVVVAPLMVQNDIVGARRTQMFKSSISIIQKITSRRLFALDRATGKLRWAHWDRRGGPVSERFTGHEVCGPPTIVGDTVFVPTHDLAGAIAFYLAAYDLHTGEPRWRTLICSSGQEVNMFGNARQEFAAAPLAVDNGVVYGTTNLGVVFAVNADDGSVRWLSGYEVIPLPPTQLRNQRPRRVHFANNPPVVAHGLVVTTPLDSEFALAMDQSTGRTKWRLPWRAGSPEVPVRWCLGTLGDEFYFSGFGVLAVRAEPVRADSTRPVVRVVAARERLGETKSFQLDHAPRGAIVKDAIYYQNSSRELFVLDRDGLDVSPRSNIELRDLGNILGADGFLTVAGPSEVTIYADFEALFDQAEQAVTERPDDPVAHLRLASFTLALVRDEASPDALRGALSVFERGLQVAERAGLGDGSPIFSSLERGRFTLARRLARRVSEIDPKRGIELLRACRDSAPDASRWIKVQLELLARVPRAQRLVELDEMRARHGNLEHYFDDAGRLSVAAWCLWESVSLVDAREAVDRCHRVLRSHASESHRIEGSLGIAASRRLGELIARHGRAVYADIEQRAQGALDAIRGDDQLALEAVVRDYPHSDAADRAVGLLLASAAASPRPDLAAALRWFTQRTDDWPLASLALLVQVADAAGNRALAHELARDMTRRFGGRPLPSNLARADDRAPDVQAWFAERTTPSAPSVPPMQPPTRVVSTLRPPALDSVLQIQASFRATGFGDAKSPTPSFVVVDAAELCVFDGTSPPDVLGDARARLPLNQLELEAIHLCGDLALVCEHTRIRALDLSTPKADVRWSFQPEARTLTALGVHSGVAMFFSSSPVDRDGGRIVGLEPLTGTLLYERDLHPARNAYAPVVTSAGVFYWDTTDGPEIRQLDPVTGRDSRVVPLGDDALEFLGLLGDRQRFRVEGIDLQSRLVALGEVLVIPTTAEDDRARARCVAVGPDGAVRWTWSGPRGNKVEMAALHEDRCVLVTSGMESSLTVLDEHGQTVLERTLGLRTSVTNWRRRGAWFPDAPDLLVLVDRSDTSPRLTCVSLTAPKPYFSRAVPEADRILFSPRIADNTLVLPIRANDGSRRQHAALLGLDLDNPLRRGLPRLPEGKPRKFAAPMVVERHGPWLVVESADGIAWIGDNDRLPERRRSDR